MTGWLDGDAARYAPHTLAGYRLPRSRTLYRVIVGLETRRRARSKRCRFMSPACAARSVIRTC